MTNQEIRKIRNLFLEEIWRTAIILTVIFFSSKSFAQVRSSVDSTNILIGEEIRYTLQVESDSTDIVVFPEGQTFQPLEVIESLVTDTLINGKKYTLTKEYALTQFDSGAYTIPRQKVLIGAKEFYTDSLQVEVRNVAVDTTQQKMYEIKPLTEVEADFSGLRKNIWWILVPLVLIGLVLFFVLRKRKEKKNKKIEIPPYEKAILALKEIDESQLLEQDSHKEYYSRLSDTARKYIDEEIYDHAMESTTDELIARLDQEIKTGHLNLSKQTVEDLKKVLKTADMAKFAKSKPDIGTAKADRNAIERVIVETKEAIPEPTEEELLANEEYRLEKLRKRNRTKTIIGIVAIVFILISTLVGYGLYTGFNVMKDQVFGHPTKELAEGKWYSSAYGNPPVTLSTPKILVRNNLKLTDEQRQILKNSETFVYGSLLGNFSIMVSTVQFNQQQQVDLEKAVEGAVKGMEAQGAKNITFKTEEYETLGGAKGLKVFGEFEALNPVTQKEHKANYQMLYFKEGGGFQQIMVAYNKDDRYADEVTQRIINSVELRNAE